MKTSAALGRRRGDAFRVDRHDDALAAKPLRRLVDELGPGDRSGVDRHLVGPSVQERTDAMISRTPPPTVSGMNTRSAVRDTTSRRIGRASCDAGCQERELVGLVAIVAGGDLDRIAGARSRRS